MSHKRRQQCRFCLEMDTQSNLISPCACKGSSKFVHNECLMKWYVQRPDRGLLCGSCIQPLARLQTRAIEDLESVQYYLQEARIYNPITILTIYHSCFFTTVFALYPYYVAHPLRFYALFQGIFHTMFLSGLYVLVSRVQNKNEYRSMWMTMERCGLVACHLSFLMLMVKTHVLGGLSADVCLFLYFFEHLEILQEMNAKGCFVFVSKPSRQRRQLS